MTARFAIAVLFGAGVSTGCADKSSAEPECGTTACPGGTRPIETVDADGTCHAACEPLQACPDWAVPVMTEACFACATIMSDGRSFAITQPLGDALEYATCDGPADPKAELTILRYAMSAEVRGGDTLDGHATLTWSDSDDRPICTARFRIDSDVDPDDAGPAPEPGEGMDRVLLARHVMDGGLTDEGCVSLDLEVLSLQVERLDHAWFWFATASDWVAWDGVTHRDVVFRLDKTNAYVDGDWYPWLQASSVDEVLDFEVLFGTASDVTGGGELPVTGAETWLWAEGEQVCDETFFVVGAWPVPSSYSDVLYEVLLARSAGSSGCTSGIWRTTRGLVGSTLTTTDDLGDEVDLLSATVEDATLPDGPQRAKVSWDATLSDATTTGQLYIEH